ncbi:hypothetical protein GUJ93_ZPchr0004g39674 [Zizania palustris]|uniref:RanBP2-type domain-containing protein n=1 Tax=Zizania palustris TaxID=103762 RepID=A0A8J5S2P6_ZIZPA|nr:hypothetical protein GUJ93_ZPchr0004g39674 [Zizania palustris]
MALSSSGRLFSPTMLSFAFSPATPPSRWPCARCTLSNARGSGVCEVCNAPRPVEVDAEREDETAWPLRKRKRAASPDVVEVCAADEDDVVAVSDASDPAKEGNFEDDFDKKTFKIMTYNVWFREDIELPSRMDALGDLIQLHSPDLICFQEVTPYIYQLLKKSDWWQEYECLLPHEIAMWRPYYCMQMSKLPVRSSDRIPFSTSTMGRELSIANVKTGGMINLVLATCHLESPSPVPPRWDQMHSEARVAQANESLRILGEFRDAIFCGDMNWDDKGDGPFPLPDGWVDAWAELKPGDDGWTYDTKANGMLSGNRNQQKRMDRFVCRLSNFKIDDVEMIGKEAIPGVSFYREKIVDEVVHKRKLPVFPSDHFGLVLTITRQDDIF